MTRDYEKELAVRIWRDRTVSCKFQNYLLYHQGLYGNKPLAWDSLKDVKRSGYDGLVCIRSKKGIQRSRVVYNVPIEQARKVVAEWKASGISEGDITFNQSMPDQELLVQGEVCRQHWRAPFGYALHGTFVKKPMNLALAEASFDLEGGAALALLRDKLWTQSFSDIVSLLDQFPQAAIEFSAYGTNVGDQPARNAVVWEVREY